MFKGKISGKSSSEDIFAKYLEDPPDEVKRNLKKLKPEAMMVREMTETQGWKKVVKPFLQRYGNPSLLFNLIKEDKRDEIAKVECYHRLLRYIENLCSIADRIAVIEAQEIGGNGEDEQVM